MFQTYCKLYTLQYKVYANNKVLLLRDDVCLHRKQVRIMYIVRHLVSDTHETFLNDRYIQISKELDIYQRKSLELLHNLKSCLPYKLAMVLL